MGSSFIGNTPTAHFLVLQALRAPAAVPHDVKGQICCLTLMSGETFLRVVILEIDTDLGPDVAAI